MKILVTGSAGFVGSHLVDALLKAGHRVHGIDNFSTGRRANLSNPAIDQVLHYPFDIAVDRTKIEDRIAGYQYDYIFHLAAMARINECDEKPHYSTLVNLESVLWLVDKARQYGVKGFVFSSSSSVYGEVKEEVPIREDRLHNPANLYGIQKSAAEKLVLRYGKLYPDIKVAALRYFNVWGTKRNNPEGAYPQVFSSFQKRYLQKLPLIIYGDGEQRRDFVHVFDVVRANMRFLEADAVWGQAYNIGTGQTHSINEVAALWTKAVGIEHHPARAGDIRFSCADIFEAREILKWQAKISFEEGVDIWKKS